MVYFEKLNDLNNKFIKLMDQNDSRLKDKRLKNIFCIHIFILEIILDKIEYFQGFHYYNLISVPNFYTFLF